ncbi:MAG: APC family permease [Anaerolineae bacterium]|nr:APC family permease [Anaerolineae bacterium]
MNLEEDTGTTVLRHTDDTKPPFSWRSLLFGTPIATSDAAHQTIGKAVGLAVFASDALSSTAYATQEMMVILILAGTAALGISSYLIFAIIILLAILTISYEQTIHAYPSGGGAYIVAHDNLGELPAQTAGAALLTDYILTVAVSISSGVAQIVSAWPQLYEYRVWIAVACVIFIMTINLRGVKESGIIFAIPTYFFLAMTLITLLVAIYKYFMGTLGVVQDPPMDMMPVVAQPITLFLILKALASGTTAVTGVEAISNGITAFKEPRSRNAGITLIWMSVILGSFLLGITFFAHLTAAMPSEEETVISQLARTVTGRESFLYLAQIFATTLILIMAANTAFADFPRLSALIAADGFLPRQLAFRGDRLVFSRGIISLSVIASLLIIIFQASVTRLIPLYAIGVFLSFTLSQAGMARRWFRCGKIKPGETLEGKGKTLHFEKNWKLKMVINAAGAVFTLVVMVIFAMTKFQDGAWVVVILIPAIIGCFYLIHRHYKIVARNLSLEHYGAPPRVVRHRVIIPLAGVHRGSLAALRYARKLTDDITAVHVSIDPVETERLYHKWEHYGDGVRLVILESPYRVLMNPLLDYIDHMYAQCQSNEVITIVVPQFIPEHSWTGFLHTRTADNLRRALLHHKEIVITEVPYQIEQKSDAGKVR